MNGKYWRNKKQNSRRNRTFSFGIVELISECYDCGSSIIFIEMQCKVLTLKLISKIILKLISDGVDVILPEMIKEIEQVFDIFIVK